ALVLVILGFTLGPVLIIGLLVIVLFLVLRPVIQNFTAGLVLQMRGHCQPSDIVEIDGELGTVEEVNTRAVVLHTADGRTVVLPNDQVIAGKLINYSKLGRRRSHITVRLPPDADVGAFTRHVGVVLGPLPAVLDDPAPQVLLSGFDGQQPWADITSGSAPRSRPSSPHATPSAGRSPPWSKGRT
ncbi:MAG: mechanosensitive ion channel family protein, partial [Acidimicrobiia bacterium]|nr:mechanosensitive ion channel family protein [Acidimicrobiia bacterium]